VTAGFFSAALNEFKLEAFLHEDANRGWRFVKLIRETKMILGIVSREARFVIFERHL
jgi:hypothetical protein